MATARHVSAVPPSAVTLVTQTRVSPSHDAEFARRQEQLNHALAHFPGYLDHTVLPPHPPAQVDWVVVHRFASRETARAWLQSEQRLQLLRTIQPLLVGQDDVHLFADDSELRLPAPVTAIISIRVQPGQEAAFQEWQRRIATVEATFEGFTGYRLEPPVPGVQDHWLTMLRFDSDAHLDAWLNSEQRQQLLAETPRFSTESRTRKVHTGFDAWFTGGGQVVASELPPVWKQNMVVLLVLYPTVFLFGSFVQTPLLINRGMPFWLGLFLANAVITGVLGWYFVPWASRALYWWLNPTPTSRVNWAGVGLIVALYGLCLLVFSQFPS